jgi:hypothetical protein
LSLTRIRQSAALLGAILAVVTLISLLAVGMVGFLSQQATDGVQAGLSNRAGADLALRPALRVGANPEKQDAEVRAAVIGSFGPTGVDMQVYRSVEKRITLRTTDTDGSDRDSIGQAVSYDDAQDRLELVDGAFPGGTNEVMVQERAAEDLGLVVGEQLLMDGARFTVVGTWRPADYLDPRWYGDPLVVTGLEQDEYGPFVIDESSWRRLDDDARVRWTLVPDITQITSTNLAEIVTAWSHIDSDWRGKVDGLETLEKQGRFAQTADQLGVRVRGLSAIQPVVLLLLAAIAIVALAELGRLLATNRATETALIWSRGASAADIARATGIEVALASALGLVLGGAAGVGVLILVTGSAAVVLTLGTAAWAVPVAGALSACILAAVSSYRSAGVLTVRDPSDASGRVRRLTAPGLVILVSAAAALTVWQLRLYGSPVTPSSTGGSSVDPIAVVAPSLALIAIVLVVVLVFPLLAGLGDRVAGRGSIAGQLAVRTVARRASLAIAPLVVVSLATGSIVVAAAYSATWTRAFDITGALRAGADVHVTSRIDGIGPTALADVTAVPEVDLAAPVEVQPLSLGGESGSIVGVSPAAVAAIATSASGTFDPAGAADAIRAGGPAPEFPADSTGLELTARLTEFRSPPSASLWIVDDLGILREVPMTRTSDELSIDNVTFAADLPSLGSVSGVAPRIMAINVGIPEAAIDGDMFGRMTVTSITATGPGGTTDLELDQYWIPDSTALMFSPPNSDGSGLGFVVYSDTPEVRLTPSFDGTFDDRINPKVVVSQQLADFFDVGVGERISFPLQDGINRMDALIAAVVPAIPGSPSNLALMIDLSVIQHYQLRTTAAPAPARDIWIATSDPGGVAAEIRDAFPANAQIDTAVDEAGRQVLGSASIALWAGAGACGILALIGVAVAARSQLRSRRGEVAVLRAIGLGSSDQAGIRARELGLYLGAGLLTGAIAGATVALLTVPQLARAAIPAPYPAIGTELAVDLTALVLALGALVAALAVVVAISALGVSAIARRALPSEGST